jgi:hypothetical protein
VTFVHSGSSGDRVSGGANGPIDLPRARRLRPQSDGDHRHAGHERRRVSPV